MSGEAPEYFARYKLGVLRRVLGEDFARPLLDFGCGIGNVTKHLVEAFPLVHGYDPSSASVKVAQEGAIDASVGTFPWVRAGICHRA